MAILVWVLIALAIWHFTVFVPDRFAGGIVGGFFAAIVGGIVSGVLLSGFDLPSRHDTDVLTVVLGIPGAIVALALLYAYGARLEARGDSAP